METCGVISERFIHLNKLLTENYKNAYVGPSFLNLWDNNP